MKLEPLFSKDDIKKILTEQLKRLDAVILERLKFIGEDFIRNARENGTYTDQTGNLRNSIGYIILRDGEQLFDNFRKAAKVKVKYVDKNGKSKTKLSKGADEGIEYGRTLAHDIGKEYPKGYVLIVVAGMDYAAAVESKGKDVLTASSITAKNALIKSIENIKNALSKVA